MMNNTSPTKDRYLNKTDIAKLLNCSHQTVMRMAKSGELPQPVRFSHKMVRWRESDIVRALLGRGVNVVS